jgi:putative ABC transport system substrate-binding protein
MKRRDFIALLGGAAAVCPIAARAQQTGQIHRIGFLGPAPDNPLFVRSYPEFLAELRKLGFTEGGNLIVENRRIDEGAPKAFAAAAEVIRSKVDVVVTFGPELR